MFWELDYIPKSTLNGHGESFKAKELEGNNSCESH